MASLSVHSWTGERLQMCDGREQAELFLDPDKSVSKPDGQL